MPVAAENYCSYIMRSLTVIFAITGLICSFRASKTCDFISFEDNGGDPADFDPPFDQALAANVGIFRYEISSVVNGGGSMGCIAYDERFTHQHSYPSLATAQFCSVIGPCFAILGTFLVLLDVCLCNFPGSFTFASTCLLVATGVQAGTFTLVADPVFCFEDSGSECTSGKGVYLSCAAVIWLFVAACLNCCAPEADPFCFNFGQKKEDRPVGTNVQRNPTRTVVLQPVVIQTPVAPATAHRKKKKTVKKVQTKKRRGMEDRRGGRGFEDEF